MYSGPRKIFGRYWRAYGGFKSLLRSVYLHLAIVLCLLTAYTWHAPVCSTQGACSYWWDYSLSILPNLLGFTLGGFAIFIGFGDERFHQALAQGDPDSPKETMYVRLCATFVHFILVQITALIFAVLTKSLWFYWPFLDKYRSYINLLNGIVGLIGFGLFLYSLTLVLAATMHVFRIASMYQLQKTYERRPSKENPVG